jgi:hypothetical protein
MLEQTGTRAAGLFQAGLLQHAAQPTSEPETAFRVTFDDHGARAALRRPDAEHQARPALKTQPHGSKEEWVKQGRAVARGDLAPLTTRPPLDILTLNYLVLRRS